MARTDLQARAKHSSGPAPAPATAETRPTELPKWAQGATNLRGVLPLSRAHYTATLVIQQGDTHVCMEAFVDTSGARTMMDLRTAQKAGLKIQLAGKGNEHGVFWGPSGGPPAPYAGMVAGPVTFWFDRHISVVIPEIKLVHNDDVLVLLGTDAMASSGGE